MNKSSAIYLAVACFGFLFLALGGVLLILGVFLENDTGIYIGIGLCLFSILIYVVLLILILIQFLKNRR